MRIQLSIDEGDLEAIDKAATTAGESRSQYMALASLDRAGAAGGVLTGAQSKAVRRIVSNLLNEKGEGDE